MTTVNDTLVRFACPSCRKSLKVPTRYAGRRVKCPKCQHSFLIGSEPEVVEATLVEEELQTSPLPRIFPSQLRVGGESQILYCTLFIAVGVFFVLSLSTAFVFLIAAAFVYFDVVGHEARLRQSAKKVCKTTSPKLDSLINIASCRLTMPTPNLFAVENNEVNAYAIGFHAPGTVVLHSGLLEMMNDDEILFIIGHELTHLKCGHCKFLVFTNATIGSAINQIAATIVDLIFMAWSRKTEYTCDRGGLIACKDPQSAMTALAKLEHSGDEDILSEINNAIRGQQTANNALSTHPETRNRISAIWEYSQTDDFRSLTSIWH